MKLDLPLSTQAIRSIDRETFAEVMRLASAGTHWDDVRRQAQRTLHRGLDCGAFGLDRDLKIRMRIDLDDYDNHIGPESSGPATQEGNAGMNASNILVFGPTLSDDADAEVQPSLQEMVREHYARRFGPAGAQIAESYLERLIDGVTALEEEGRPAEESSSAAESAAEAAPAEGRRPSPTDHDRTPLRAVVMAIVKHHDGVSGGERINISQLERMVRMWREDQRLVAAHPVLGRTDDQGGFSVNDESPLHVGAIARGLVSDGLLDRDSGGFAPPGTLAEEDREYERRRSTRADADAGAKSTEQPKVAERPEAPEQPQAPQRDPMDGLKQVFKTLGVDVKLGGVDLVKGVERSSRTGNAMPLVASIATAFLAAAAASEINRED